MLQIMGASSAGGTKILKSPVQELDITQRYLTLVQQQL